MTEHVLSPNATKDSLEVQARKENISVNATRDFDDYHPTDEELNELKEIIRDTKDLTRGNNISLFKKPCIQNKNTSLNLNER